MEAVQILVLSAVLMVTTVSGAPVSSTTETTETRTTTTTTKTARAPPQQYAVWVPYYYNQYGRDPRVVDPGPPAPSNFYPQAQYIAPRVQNQESNPVNPVSGSSGYQPGYGYRQGYDLNLPTGYRIPYNYPLMYAPDFGYDNYRQMYGSPY